MDNQNDNTTPPTPDRRPLGYWLRTVDGLLTQEFATALEAEGVTRRDWMLLNVLSRDVDAPGLAERLARKGKRLRRLEERGWVEEQGVGAWTLTDAGREAKERIGEVVDGIRARVLAAVGEDAYATTMASLEAIARELGWDENTPRPGRRFRGGPGFGGPRPFRPDIRFGWGPNLHRGFAPGRPGRPAERGDEPYSGDLGEDAYDDGCRGHGPRGRHGHAHHHHHHGHGHHHGHRGHGHGRSRGEALLDAYERGFDAGFTRGRDAA